MQQAKRVDGHVGVFMDYSDSPPNGILQITGEKRRKTESSGSQPISSVQENVRRASGADNHQSGQGDFQSKSGWMGSSLSGTEVLTAMSGFCVVLGLFAAGPVVTGVIMEVWTEGQT